MRSLALTLALLLGIAMPSFAATRVEPLEGGALFKVVFSHSPVIAAKTVTVAGSWNGWSKTATPLQDKDGDGKFEATVELPRGRHQYKFVLNGEVWQHDGDNPAKDTDGNSGFNSVLDLGSNAAGAPGSRGDGKIASGELLSNPKSLSFAAAIDGRKRVVLRVHALKDDVTSVAVSASPRPLNAGEGDLVAARRIATVDGRDVWEARLTFAAAPKSLRWQFVARDGDGKEAEVRLPAGRERFSASGGELGRFTTPTWVRDAIFYQIFPDRFRDGKKDLPTDRQPRPQGKPWNIDDSYLDAWDAEPAHHNMMGGDLPGVTEKAEYLKELGVTSLYLNPIFTAASNHKYDAADFESVDPSFGILDDFHALRDALKARGMNMILDCVFNHTGDEHGAFRDCVEKGPSSKYWGWYFIDGHPITRSPKPNYRCWWNFSDLPQLNTANPDVVKHLLGVSLKWLKEGSAGWRLDVPNEVDAVNPEFWREFRKKVKRQDPDAYVVGEIWTEATSWLQGDKFDAVMNYPVRSAALEFMSKTDGPISAQDFAGALQAQLATYPEPALQVQFNLLGSHDTVRLRTAANGDIRRARLCMTFLFGWPGAPVIYYGDEVGLLGGKDPECRRTYPWDQPAKQDAPTLEHVKKLCATRKAEPALRRGTVRFLVTDGRVCAFVREPEHGDPGRPVVVVLNSGTGATTVSVPLDGLPQRTATSLLGPAARIESGKLLVDLPALEGAHVALE